MTDEPIMHFADQHGNITRKVNAKGEIYSRPVRMMHSRAEKYEVTGNTLNFYLRAESGGWVSYCPALGVASQGDTQKEAIKNMVEAIDCFLEGAEEIYRENLAKELETVIQ